MSVRTSFDGSVATVVIDRPEAMNAVSPDVLAELHSALDAVERAQAAVCIITGAGERAFSAGADLSEMLAFTADEARAQLAEGVRLTRRLETGAFVSIAAINGYALGGGAEIALACSLRFAGRSVKFGLPEVTVGIFPGWGGIVRLPRQAPLPIAMDMILSGRILSADEALAAGLVEDVVDDPVAAAQLAARRILSGGPQARMLARSVVYETLPLDLDEALSVASERWMTFVGSEERTEGHTAFIEKRAPSWAPAVTAMRSASPEGSST